MASKNNERMKMVMEELVTEKLHGRRETAIKTSGLINHLVVNTVLQAVTGHVETSVETALGEVIGIYGIVFGNLGKH